MTEQPPASPTALAPHQGNLILVLGILSLTVCGILTGIPAWIMGNNDLQKMRQGLMDRAGESTTKAGLIMGMISVILAIFGIVFAVIWFFLMGAFFFTVARHDFH